MKIRTYRGQITLSKIDEICHCYPIPDIHDSYAYTKFAENPLAFTQVIVQNWKYGWTDVRQTDGHMDNQRGIIIPRHYRVAGYESYLQLNLTFAIATAQLYPASSINWSTLKAYSVKSSWSISCASFWLKYTRK